MIAKYFHYRKDSSWKVPNGLLLPSNVICHLTKVETAVNIELTAADSLQKLYARLHFMLKRSLGLAKEEPNDFLQ
jgi:hypothetical protein